LLILTCFFSKPTVKIRLSRFCEPSLPGFSREIRLPLENPFAALPGTYQQFVALQRKIV
jgi:hypothetical protein